MLHVLAKKGATCAPPRARYARPSKHPRLQYCIHAEHFHIPDARSTVVLHTAEMPEPPSKRLKAMLHAQRLDMIPLSQRTICRSKIKTLSMDLRAVYLDPGFFRESIPCILMWQEQCILPECRQYFTLDLGAEFSPYILRALLFIFSATTTVSSWTKCQERPPLL